MLATPTVPARRPERPGSAVTLVLSVSLVTVGCGAPPLASDTARSLAFLAPYARFLSRSCQDSDLEVTFSLPGSGVLGAQIDTDPPITESHWELAVCGRRMELTMDCGASCWAHEWPLPAHVATRRFEDPVLEELLAVVEAGLPCQDDESGCCTHRVRLRRTRVQAGSPTRYEITRCGHTQLVEVQCSAKEWARCTGSPATSPGR